jgi:hypothetical protein
MVRAYSTRKRWFFNTGLKPGAIILAAYGSLKSQYFIHLV